MTDLHVVVLAAGKGTRMKSALPKVLHRVAGVPMIEHVLKTARSLSPASVTLVVGHMADRVRAALMPGWPELQLVVQEPQLGTAHALQQTECVLAGASGTIVLLSGDVPLLTARTLSNLLEEHRAGAAAATLLTAVFDDPSGYGRVVRDEGGVARIVEHRDASKAERAIAEINAGIYAFEAGPLFPALREVASANAQGEYYLPDLAAIYRRKGLKVWAVRVPAPHEIRGINSRKELAEVSKILWQERNEALMAAGVTIEDPAATYIGAEVEVGPDTVIRPGVILEGRTRIGANCEIHAGVRIVNSELGDGVVVLDCCLINGARIADNCRVGPFAHLRPDSDMREGAHVGNFVELKKTVLGSGSKANHLAYLGDATIGERVNVGAGTITCNYDGVSKHPTVIEDGAFIGSDSQLIAPVRIGRGAYVAAGSSISKDVPAGALGVARGRQFNKEGWAEKKKSRS